MKQSLRCGKQLCSTTELIETCANNTFVKKSIKSHEYFEGIDDLM